MNAETQAPETGTKIAEYSKTEAALAVTHRFGALVADATTTDGLTVLIKARAEIRGYRTGLEKERQRIKAPALEMCRQIDYQAQDLTAKLFALEKPIDAQIKIEEERKEKEKAAREQKERERISNIHRLIGEFPTYVGDCASKSAAEIAEILRALKIQDPQPDDYEELIEPAREAYAKALATVEQLHAGAVAQEALLAEQAKAREVERADLERRNREVAEREATAKAEEDARRERQRIEDEAREAENAKRRAAIEAEQAEARAKIETEQRAAREKMEAEAKAAAIERARIAAEDAEAARVIREAIEKTQAEQRAEAERLAAEERRIQHAQLMRADADAMLAQFLKTYGHIERFAAVVAAIKEYMERAK